MQITLIRKALNGRVREGMADAKNKEDWVRTVLRSHLSHKAVNERGGDVQTEPWLSKVARQGSGVEGNGVLAGKRPEGGESGC